MNQASGDTGPSGSNVLDRCLGSLDGGILERVAPFVGERERTLEAKTGAGLDARWVLDLTKLSTEDLVLDQARLFVRTEAPIGLADRIAAGWSVRVEGDGDAVDVPVDAILTETADRGAVHMECSGNTDFGGYGLQGAVVWAGVPISWFLDQVSALDGGLIEVAGYDEHPPPEGSSTPGAAWIFRPEDLTNAFVATHIGDEPLSEDHGAPVRLMVPGWYGCTCIKWVESIRWVPADSPATSQMQEFAQRTEQTAVHDLARDFTPAVNDVAATPVRVEVWDVDGRRRVRVIGLVWGGTEPRPVPRLWANGEDLGLVEPCDEDTADTWALWSITLPNRFRGSVRLTLTIDDPAVQTRRLDRDYYARTVEI